MNASYRMSNKLLFCLVIIIILNASLSESQRRKQRSRRTYPTQIIEVNRRRHHNRLSHDNSNFRKSFYLSTNRRRTRSNAKNKRYRYQHSKRKHRHQNVRTDTIKEADLRLPGLHQILQPSLWDKRISEMLAPMKTGHLEGVVRLKRLYCRVGIGFHLEIKPDGRVGASHHATADSIIEIFSVKMSVVGIRSAQSRLYLCMNKAGRVFTRKRFQPDCEFRENLEGNNFNTYASEQYSNHRTRQGYFLAITRHGTIPRRMRKTSWTQKRAHWLPRTV